MVINLLEKDWAQDWIGNILVLDLIPGGVIAPIWNECSVKPLRIDSCAFSFALRILARYDAKITENSPLAQIP